VGKVLRKRKEARISLCCQRGTTNEDRNNCEERDAQFIRGKKKNKGDKRGDEKSRYSLVEEALNGPVFL